jgi:hypothetical protein
MSLIVLLFLIGVFWVAPILICRWFGKMLESPNAWLWGLFLGWIGVMILTFKVPWKMGRAFMKETGFKPTISGATQEVSALRARALGEVKDGKTCPACAETVQAAATVCRFCGHQFAKVEASAELAT